MGRPNIARNVVFLKLIFVILNVLIFVVKLKGQQPTEAIRLYDEKDDVVDLTDETINSIIDSGKIWILEFYAHWCGHCQRFAPVWKKVAKKFRGK